MAPSLNIPISEQHAFLDCAKQFEWPEVKRYVQENPAFANVQPCGRDGTPRWSALHQAAFGGSTDAVNFLLISNAAPDAKTKDGQTALDVAKTADVKAILRKFVAGDAKEEALPESQTQPRVLQMPKATKSVLTAKKPKTAKKPTKALSSATVKTIKPKKQVIAKGKRGKALVYSGKFKNTVGGLVKEQLTKSRAGKIVSKRMQAIGKDRGYTNIKGWIQAMMTARAALGLCGFVTVKKGSALYCKTMELYRS